MRRWQRLPRSDKERHQVQRVGYGRCVEPPMPLRTVSRDARSTRTPGRWLRTGRARRRETSARSGCCRRLTPGQCRVRRTTSAGWWPMSAEVPTVPGDRAGAANGIWTAGEHLVINWIVCDQRAPRVPRRAGLVPDTGGWRAAGPRHRNVFPPDFCTPVVAADMPCDPGLGHLDNCFNLDREPEREGGYPYG
jgi:hypothetical protein